MGLARKELEVALRERRDTVLGTSIFARFATFGDSDDRPAIVLVHGFIISSRYMLPLAKCLAPSYRVYAPDLPGFGHSDKPPEVLDVDQTADALAAWMSNVGLQSATFVGNSFGCQIVAALAVRHRALVSRLVLIAPSIDPYHKTLLRQGARLLLDATREPLSLIPLHLADLFRAGPRTVLKTLRYMWHDHIKQDLPNIVAPTLVVRGTRDPLASSRWIDDVTRLLPNGERIDIPGAAHAVNYNSPEALATLIHEFLKRQDRVAEP